MFSLFILSGCGVPQDHHEDVLLNDEMQETNAWEGMQETDEKDMVVTEPELEAAEPKPETAEPEPEALLDAFLASEIPAIYDDGEEGGILFDQLPHDEDEWDCYSVGERIDLDNDGENEQIVNGPYGGMYFDARDGKVYVLAEGEGTAGVLSYAVYDHATWIVHSDTWHVGRQIYWLTRYEGGDNIVDEFKLGAEYWESTDDQYDESSDFTYRDEKISMGEYEELIKEIFGILR